MWAELALRRFVRECGVGAQVLDIGPGAGEQRAAMIESGLAVTTAGLGCDIEGLWPPRYIVGSFDGVWSSHVLEHSPVPGLFLMACFDVLAADGVLAVTVPPYKPQLVGGHLSLWTPGLLVYHCVLAGFDCRDAWVKAYGYNISLVVRKRPSFLPRLAHDAGDISRLAEFFPVGVFDGIDGRVVVT